MKAKDLMIGDWVYIYHPTRERTPVKVDGVWIETIERIDNGLTREDSPMFRIVEPIPLTPEILEKNGWYLWEIEGEYRRGVDFVVYGEKAPFTVFDGIEINYVHEFQHCLKLVGIEKEIEL